MQRVVHPQAATVILNGQEIKIHVYQLVSLVWLLQFNSEMAGDVGDPVRQDLAEALRIAKGLGKNVGILNPHEHPSAVLGRHATFQKDIRRGVLAASQLPNPVIDARGLIHKPATW